MTDQTNDQKLIDQYGQKPAEKRLMTAIEEINAKPESEKPNSVEGIGPLGDACEEKASHLEEVIEHLETRHRNVVAELQKTAEHFRAVARSAAKVEEEHSKMLEQAEKQAEQSCQAASQILGLFKLPQLQ